MINNIKELLKNICEDYNSDLQQRDKVKSIINTIENINVSEVSEFYTRISGKVYSGIKFRIPDIEYSICYVLKLPPSGGDYEIGGGVSQDKIIVMSLSADSSNPEFINPDGHVIVSNILNRFKHELEHTNLESTLTHELIHVLDRTRGTKDSAGKIKNSNKIDSIEDYINTPAEFNAYYQEVISQLDNRLNRLEDKDLANRIEKYLKLPSIDMVFKIFQYHFFIDNLNSIYRKKLLKRLYGYFYNKLQSLKR